VQLTAQLGKEQRGRTEAEEHLRQAEAALQEAWEDSVKQTQKRLLDVFLSARVDVG
jgi:hypothetical protein